MKELPFCVEREVLIRAWRETVFRFLTDSARLASWWGAGSSIDPRIGGAVRICYPGGTVALGEIQELEPERLIGFSYGYEGEGKPIPPGGSRVTLRLEDEPEGTRLRLRHDVESAEVRDQHVPGWRYQLALLANAVAAEAHAGATERLDALLRAWVEPDPAARRALLDGSVDPEVVFRDAHACVRGVAELAAHIEAIQLHMPGVRLERDGPIQLCQGTGLSAWTATGADGAPRGRGSHTFELSPDGRITRVVGFWRT